MSKSRIGILGGTFDPIHYGHLILAEQAREQFDLSKVIFVTAAQPPHKMGLPVTDAELRYEMTKLAVETNPFFELSRIELDREGPSFTVDTLRDMLQDSVEMYLLLGADEAQDFPKWREPDQIADMAVILAANRPGLEGNKIFDGYSENILRKSRQIDMPGVDISSTDIRERVKAGRTIKYLVPPEVEEFILQRGLY